MRNKRLYNIWSCMKQRCFNPNHTAAPWYHDKGIVVCDSWLDFHEFEKWALSHGYSDQLSIDRINPDKNYEPENCRWIPIQENRKRAKKVYGSQRNYASKKGKFMVVKSSSPFSAYAIVIKTGLSKHNALELSKSLMSNKSFSSRTFYEVKVTDGHAEGEFVDWEKLRNYLNEEKKIRRERI